MSELYNEVLKNLSWYQLNSEFNDPMYQYMLNISRELNNAKPKASFINANYEAVDDFIVNVKNQTLQYGTYQCSVPEKQAFMDSMFSCFLFQLPFFLENIQIGIIGFIFVVPIMLISIFGGIKESYSSFILNQAIWDAFLCYDFICAKPTLLGWSNLNYTQKNTCFYRQQNSDFGTFLYLAKQGFRICIRNASFIPIFHLAFSRYICMYFPGFYKKFKKYGYKIVIFILLFNISTLTIFSLASTTAVSAINWIYQESLKCDAHCPNPKNASFCNQNFPKYFQCNNRVTIDSKNSLNAQYQLTKIFKYISYSIPPTMFFLSIICAGCLFYKIASQLQFQRKTNPESFKQTIKISFVVGFQCFTMSLIFLITGIQKYMQVKHTIFESYLIYDDLPVWLLLLQYYTTTASLNMIRILLDSCIILTVLTRYSKCVISMIKFLGLCLTNPKKVYKKIKHKINGTEVTIISISQK